MNVLHTKKRQKISKLVILFLGLTSVASLIGGIATGNVFLMGAGAAGAFLMCGAALGFQERTRPGLV